MFNRRVGSQSPVNFSKALSPVNTDILPKSNFFGGTFNNQSQSPRNMMQSKFNEEKLRVINGNKVRNADNNRAKTIITQSNENNSKLIGLSKTANNFFPSNNFTKSPNQPTFKWSNDLSKFPQSTRNE